MKKTRVSTFSYGLRTTEYPLLLRTAPGAVVVERHCLRLSGSDLAFLSLGRFWLLGRADDFTPLSAIHTECGCGSQWKGGDRRSA